MGEIKKRGGVYWVRYYRNGHRYEESAHTSDRMTALELLMTREDWARRAKIHEASLRVAVVGLCSLGFNVEDVAAMVRDPKMRKHPKRRERHV